MKKMNRTIGALLAALIAGSVTTLAVAQTHDPATDPTTHADSKAVKEQAEADKKAEIAQAKADKKKTDAQADADKANAKARLKDAKHE